MTKLGNTLMATAGRLAVPSEAQEIYRAEGSAAKVDYHAKNDNAKYGRRAYFSAPRILPLHIYNIQGGLVVCRVFEEEVLGDHNAFRAHSMQQAEVLAQEDHWRTYKKEDQRRL